MALSTTSCTSQAVATLTLLSLTTLTNSIPRPPQVVVTRKRPTSLVRSRITFLAAVLRKACFGCMAAAIPLLPDRRLTQA